MQPHDVRVGVNGLGWCAPSQSRIFGDCYFGVLGFPYMQGPDIDRILMMGAPEMTPPLQTFMNCWGLRIRVSDLGQVWGALMSEDLTFRGLVQLLGLVGSLYFAPPGARKARR